MLQLITSGRQLPLRTLPPQCAQSAGLLPIGAELVSQSLYGKIPVGNG